jgi:hypothetical protein
MKKSTKLNAKAREFKPKAKPAPLPQAMATMPPLVSESKFFKGVLPGQMASRPPPTMLPPGMNVGFGSDGKLVMPENMPKGLQKLFLKAYDDGKLDDLIMKHLYGDKPTPTAEDLEELDGLTEEEEAFASQFMEEDNHHVDICSFYLEGTCKYGKKCQNFHPSGVEEISNNVKFQGDQECGICIENVLAKDRQFGILDGCEHAFCLDCIRNWRATYIKKMSKESMRMCPLCRKLSYLVIPSSSYLPGGPSKEQLVDEYKWTLGQIPCRHFNFGDGECPFLNSCFYSHISKDGKIFDYDVKARYINEDGEIVVEKEAEHTTLASLIGL